MSTPSEDGKQPEKMEPPKQQGSACCGPGCGCESGGKPNQARWVVGVIVLAAAGVLVVKGMIKSDNGWTQTVAGGFVNPAATEAAEGGAAASSGTAASTGETSVGTPLGAFAELNTVAAKSEAVFVFVPGKEGTSGNAPAAPMKAAARTIEAKGMKCGLFTLKPGSPDYDQIAKQMALPGVLALVKGSGMSAVSGEVTEAKLLQGYVAAGSAGACGPAASPGCCPK